MRYCIILALLMSSASLIAQTGEWGKPENLGKAVNSKYDDLAPVISPDGNTLYIVRGKCPDNVGYYLSEDDQDIWYSVHQPDGSWSKMKNIGTTLNTVESNSMGGITPDGHVALLMGYYRDGVYAKAGYSFTRMSTTGWSPPQGIDIEDYEHMAKGKYVSSCFPNDSRTLLLSFSSDPEVRDADLYVCFLQTDRSWSRPLALGAGVNSPYDDSCPFLASDGVTLYFCSNRPGGLGDHDIYMTRRLDSSWTRWLPPVNIGPPINTDDGDMYFTIPAAGDYAYYVSYKGSYGLGDINRVKIAEKVKPNPVLLISGSVLDQKTGQPLEATITYEDLSSGKIAGKARSNPTTGEYKVVLPYGVRYGIYATIVGYYSISESFDATAITAYQEITRDIHIVPIEKGEKIRLNNVFFDFNSSSLRSESFPELQRVLQFLRDNPTVAIEIQGHTDNVGTDSYNMQLSNDRAKAIADYLTANGAPVARVTHKGYGETQPAETNDTEEGRQLNRRVQFKILEK